MGNPFRLFFTTIILCAWISLSALVPLSGQSQTSPANPESLFTSRSDPWPGVRWLDARLLVKILRGQPGLLEEQADGSRRIVWAKTVVMKRRIIPGQDFPGKDGPWHLVYGPFDPSRWDIIVNGVPIDPRLYFLEWDGAICNLGMLFTFREELPESGDTLDSIKSPWNTDSL